ncbi:hypothetical protein, partial [Ancylobacter tetraedralis]|uniref:hypothetical protein n=1 Tax=Ancylobacter tetraedralis TaxID=217068 RepID=UPI001AEE29E1
SLPGLQSTARFFTNQQIPAVVTPRRGFCASKYARVPKAVGLDAVTLKNWTVRDQAVILPSFEGGRAVL